MRGREQSIDHTSSGSTWGRGWQRQADLHSEASQLYTVSPSTVWDTCGFPPLPTCKLMSLLKMLLRWVILVSLKSLKVEILVTES